jgi:hypothetical protein
MARRKPTQEEWRTSYPAIPDELLAMLSDDGTFKHAYAWDAPNGQVVRPPEWDRYKVLKRTYCGQASIRLVDFNKVARDQLRNT